jgi:hypothetical protein
MNNSLSLPPEEDLDTVMRKVARDLAMGIYEIEQILEARSVTTSDFHYWKTHPRFLEYLRSEREAWSAATNTAERTKLKASIVMEEFMVNAHTELANTKTPLNQRVELGKLLAKIAGMGEPRVFGGGGGGNGAPTFQLQINIGPGIAPVTIRPEMGKIINYDEAEIVTPTQAIETYYEDDGYDPLVSPQTLDDE